LGGAQRVQVDAAPIGGLHDADRDDVAFGGALPQLVELGLDQRDAPAGLRAERPGDARELACRNEHPRAVGHARREQPHQRRHRPADRHPRRRHPDEVGERATADRCGLVEVGRAAPAGAPGVHRGRHGIGDRRRRYADARGVEVAVGDIELATERRPHACDSRPVQTEVIEIRTGTHEAVVALDQEIDRFLAAAGAREGLLSVWVPHATAGLAVIETGAGSDADLLAALRDLLPAHDRWRHRHGSAGHGRDHVLPAIVSPSLAVPVLDGRPALGTWQSVCLVDTNRDNPVRSVRLSFLAG
jgi:secondary thiamine-phosphate synthase enzyme